MPLHDVWEVRLSGGGPGRHLKDFRAVVERPGAGPGLAVRLLFGLRRALGSVFHLDDAREAPLPSISYVHRLTDAERARSLEPPGSRWGLLRLVYACPDEALGEVVNRTVHAFSFLGMAPAGDGYRVHWAIYVRPVGSLTRPYMALINPFRRRVVYPRLIRSYEEAWKAAHASPP